MRRAPADCWYPSQLQIENHTNVNTPHYTYPVQPKTCQLVPARQHLSPGILSGDRWGGARGEGSYLISSTATYRSERCTVLVCFDYRYCFTCLSASLSARSPSSKLLDVGKRPCAKSKYCKGCYRHPAERNVKTLAKHSSWSVSLAQMALAHMASLMRLITRRLNDQRPAMARSRQSSRRWERHASMEYLDCTSI